MRLVRLRAPGGPEQLAVEAADRPRPGAGVAAGDEVFALTRFDHGRSRPAIAC
jgi:hypothetical protein